MALRILLQGTLSFVFKYTKLSCEESLQPDCKQGLVFPEKKENPLSLAAKPEETLPMDVQLPYQWIYSYLTIG